MYTDIVGEDIASSYKTAFWRHVRHSKKTSGIPIVPTKLSK